MAGKPIRACLLAVNLSAVAFSGCTLLGLLFLDFHSDNTQRSPTVSVSVTDAIEREKDSAEETMAPTEPITNKIPPIESTPPTIIEVESLLEDIDSALFEFKILLGSTEHWDVKQP